MFSMCTMSCNVSTGPGEFDDGWHDILYDMFHVYGVVTTAWCEMSEKVGLTLETHPSHHEESDRLACTCE